MIKQLYPGVKVDIISLLPGFPTRQRVTIIIDDCDGIKALAVLKRLEKIPDYVPQQECRVYRAERTYSFRFDVDSYGDTRTDLVIYRMLAA